MIALHGETLRWNNEVESSLTQVCDRISRVTYGNICSY